MSEAQVERLMLKGPALENAAVADEVSTAEQLGILQAASMSAASPAVFNSSGAMLLTALRAAA